MRVARTKSSRTTSMSPRSIARGTVLCGKYGIAEAAISGQFPDGSGSPLPPPRPPAAPPRDRGGGDQRPVPRRERLVDPLPEPPRRALAPGVRELQADLRGRVRVDEVDDAAPRGNGLGLVDPRA